MPISNLLIKLNILLQSYIKYCYVLKINHCAHSYEL